MATQQLQIVNVLLEATDMNARSGRQAMPALIGNQDAPTVRDGGLGELRIPSAMFTRSMHEQQVARGHRDVGKTFPHEQLQVIGGGHGMLEFTQQSVPFETGSSHKAAFAYNIAYNQDDGRLPDLDQTSWPANCVNLC